MDPFFEFHRNVVRLVGASAVVVAAVACAPVSGTPSAPDASHSAMASASAPAAASGLTRTLVGKADVSVPGREAVVARVEVAGGGRSGRHTHPGDEISYVTDGQIELVVEGQPTRIVKAGESFVVPAGVAHDAINGAAVPARLVGVYVVEKGKPLASPAP